MTPGGRVRCALIGVGVMGSEHAAILAASPAAELVVCCDKNPEVAARVPAGCAFTTDLDAALEMQGLEAAFVATPEHHHLAAVRAALDRNLAVFCEKPIADTLAAADELASLAAHASKPLVFGHMWRFEPRYRSIAETIAAGRLGRLVHLSVRGYTPDFEGKTLAGRISLAVENGIHGVDTLRWMGGDIERVHAEASRTGVVGEGLVDAIAVTLRFVSGAVGTLETDWAMPSATGLASLDSLTVVGAEGVAWVDGRDSGAGILTSSAPPQFPGSVLLHRDPASTPYGLYRMEDEYFLALVRDGRPWPLSIADARAALVVALAIDRSIVEQRPVTMAEFSSVD